jgi:hypothetical protein
MKLFFVLLVLLNLIVIRANANVHRIEIRVDDAVKIQNFEFKGEIVTLNVTTPPLEATTLEPATPTNLPTTAAAAAQPKAPKKSAKGGVDEDGANE